MLLIKTFVILNINFFLLYFSGIFYTKLAKIKDFSFSIFFSVSLISLLISLLYFKLNVNFLYIKISIITFLIFSSLISIKILNNEILKKFFLDYLLFLLPVTFFSFLIFFYDFQYYIFRGNHYDAINYSSMSLAFVSHTFSELNDIFNNQSIKLEEDNLYYIKAAILSDHRIIAPLYFALNYSTNFVDIFYTNFINKLFFLSLTPIAVNIFFNKLKIIDYKNCYLIAGISPFCFWPIYVFEIDAFSQIMALPFSIISLYLIFNLSTKFSELSLTKLFYYLFIFVSFFCIYPEQGSVFFLFGFIYFLIKNFVLMKKKLIIKKFFLCIIFSLTIIILHENIISFLNFQIKSHTFTQFDWWRYFGAFIIGSENLILNDDFVLNLKSLAENNEWSDFEVFSYINNALFLNKFNFYYLNIIPSFFGLYYLSVGMIISTLDYFLALLILFLNLFLIKTFISNLKNIFITKNVEQIIYLKYLIIYLSFFCLFLIFTISFWQLIKLYMYFSIIIFTLIIINYSNNSNKSNINKLIVIFLIIFPIYKFSDFNYGIGKQDSFPSILNKDLKKKIDWKLHKSKILECDYIYPDIDQYDDSLYETIIYINSIIRSSNKLNYQKGENPCKKK